MARKKGRWNPDALQRIIAILLVITALVQILGTVSNAQWRLEVNNILQVHHPYLSTLPTIFADLISIMWWVLIAILGLYLLVDRNFWEELTGRD